ncbi:MAG: hypothetical protein JO337_11335 [Acidimicrobiales bacterium]|nr:hypothetical protein [Acidimicrobiales bacterium]
MAEVAIEEDEVGLAFDIDVREKRLHHRGLPGAVERFDVGRCCLNIARW